jgi:aminopeptidase N
VTSIANAWIKESGHPLLDIRAREADSGLELELSQTRYFSDTNAAPTKQRWPIPLVIKYGTAEGVREHRSVLSAEHETIRLPGAKWFFPNAGGRGFYRFRFASAFEGDRLDAGIEHLAAEERLSLVDDLWAIARHGKATLAMFLARLETMRGEEDRAVLAAIGDALSGSATTRCATRRSVRSRASSTISTARSSTPRAGPRAMATTRTRARSARAPSACSASTLARRTSATRRSTACATTSRVASA